MNSTRLESALTNWPEWGLEQAPEIVAQFSEGKSHQSYLLNNGQEELVLKLFAQPMANSISVQRWASQRALAPEINFAAPDHSYIVMQKSASDANADPAALGELLAKLHSQESPELQRLLGEFELLKYCNLYLRQCTAEINALHSKLLPALRQFDFDQTPRALCHNDLVRENCLLTSHQTHLIDWDYAQFNNPWFDLASVIVYFKLDPLQQAQLLDSYQPGYASQAGNQIYSAAICAVLWIDVLWHLAKGGEVETERQKIATLQNQAAQLGCEF